ncbi:hypothetical protein [Coxiella-like endosymbiont]|uniref:hypothetical protein n=1 Tax=Coxiella-like endosymbiont TaxID=1592897 RepID=UPI00286946FA|nr:hypothetical protein [Coxiella-like endosymbiont]
MRWGVVSSLTLKKVFSWLKVDITYDEANIIYAEGGGYYPSACPFILLLLTSNP